MASLKYLLHRKQKLLSGTWVFIYSIYMTQDPASLKKTQQNVLHHSEIQIDPTA